MNNVWNYRADTAWSEGDEIVGYSVEATDGSIGKIDEATAEMGAAYIVVDTGPWIFGKKRLIPAGLVGSIDRDDQSVTVNLSKDQVRAAPDYDSENWDEEARAEYGEYYGPYSSSAGTPSPD